MSTYYYYDFGYFIKESPYLNILTERSATAYLNAELKKIRGYSSYIDDYPQVKCEELEILYRNHQCICAMDEHLFDDLLNFNWRGIVVASWHALTTPRPLPFMSKQLQKHGASAHEKNKWLVDLAIQYLDGYSQGSREASGLFSELRGFFLLLPYEKLPLRRWPENIEQQYSDKRAKVLRAYRKGGADEAIKVNSSLATEYDLDYPDWLKLKQV